MLASILGARLSWHFANIEKIRKLTSTKQEWPRHILNDEAISR
jgi:hypothetical protein